MERKEFLKNACKFGLCTCAGMSLLSNEKLFASSEGDSDKKDDGRLGFVQRRFAKFIDFIEDPEEKKKLFEKMGRECAKEYTEEIKKYEGKLETYLNDMKGKWIEYAEYDKENKRVRMVGKKSDSCVCPFVDKSVTPKEFCNCTIGYVKYNFEILTGKTVNVEIEQSVLRGGDRCSIVVNML